MSISWSAHVSIFTHTCVDPHCAAGHKIRASWSEVFVKIVYDTLVGPVYDALVRMILWSVWHYGSRQALNAACLTVPKIIMIYRLHYGHFRLLCVCACVAYMWPLFALLDFIWNVEFDVIIEDACVLIVAASLLTEAVVEFSDTRLALEKHIGLVMQLIAQRQHYMYLKLITKTECKHKSQR